MPTATRQDVRVPATGPAQRAPSRPSLEVYRRQDEIDVLMPIG
jgi:hypothetical protein